MNPDQLFQPKGLIVNQSTTKICARKLVMDNNYVNATHCLKETSTAIIPKRRMLVNATVNIYFALTFFHQVNIIVEIRVERRQNLKTTIMNKTISIL